ncbi:hypothetical protein [Neptunitalea lumnitzerae]|uniref:Lipocalin-like domain-containing protein n=1 Tax=Neptunitalea lumnitzerae TaxID=2965509 RepID=A0ABQ5MJI7_9FLAO|nr:hypothetical protein [Neptunitalea sp. Y10]GLB49577.1 hypothetical protein Y10_19450 [Neptunitalea sp. Y10]
MKTRINFLTASLVIILFMSVSSMKAQSNVDFFVGTWNVMAYDLPSGDTEMVIKLNKNNEDKLEGTIGDKGDANPITISRIEVDEDLITLYYTASGHQVYTTMEKDGDTTITGSIMDMFDIEGTKKE